MTNDLITALNRVLLLLLIFDNSKKYSFYLDGKVMQIQNILINSDILKYSLIIFPFFV